MDIETYLQVHFTKVGDQTREHLQTYLDLGDELGQDVSALRRLSQRIDRARRTSTVVASE